jgi:methylase of polypeptide subunit release factors
MNEDPDDSYELAWEADGRQRRALWRSESQELPQALAEAGDTLAADAAFRLASEGTGIVWTGDYQNARHLLQALQRRVDKPPRTRTPRKDEPPAAPPSAREAFERHRASQARRALLLNRLLVVVEADRTIALRRAPDLRAALEEAWGPADGEAALVPLRELLGLVGAHEWRKKGVDVPALGERIHPHFGVFSPLRGEHLALIASAPLPPAAQAAGASAFDIGTGTGVIAALLARRGIGRIVATDLDPRALACAHENLVRLGLARGVQLLAADMFPLGRAALVACNPPWVPAQPSAGIERAVYDPDSAMLRAFLAGLAAHLAPGGEGWLVMSDLAEHLGLRTRAEMEGWIAAGGLRVVARHDTRPVHPKARDASDPLHAARSREVTSLWRLAAA